MNRRRFIALLSGTAAWPLAARAQQQRRLAALLTNSTTTPAYLALFIEGLRKLGWVEGQNLQLDIRWYEGGDRARARALAAELVATAPDVLLTGGTEALKPMHEATRTIPIVFVQVTDPVAQRFVASMAQPGGNITGLAGFESSISAKWLDLLKQMTPSLAHVAVMFHPQSRFFEIHKGAVAAAGSALGVQVIRTPVSDAGEITRAMEQLATKPDAGLMLINDNAINPHSKLITGLAIRHRIPAIYGSERHATNGGLMYYGYVRSEQYRGAAVYVDRILKGAKPGELPIQGPSRFELKINLTTAKALGIDVPMGLLLRADELVE